MKKKLLRDYSHLKLWITLALMISVISSFAQKIEVTGIIKGGDGNLIPGATIVEKGTTNGTVSNVGGEFSLNVLPDATLVVSFVGMLKQEIPVGDQRIFEVTL